MSLNMNREKSNELLDWEKIEMDVANGKHTYRAKVPGGWLLRLINTLAHPQDVDHLFLADPKYVWGSDDPKQA